MKAQLFNVIRKPAKMQIRVKEIIIAINHLFSLVILVSAV